MATVRVIVPFFDLKAREDRRVGDTFEVTEGRLAAINGTSNGVLVEVVGGDDEGLDGMTLAQLKSLATERGVTVKGRVTKARLIEALGKE